MSVLWLESFIVANKETNLFTFQSINLLIYLNMLSCFCFLIYSLLYNMDLYMQKAPNTLIILKMFSECLLSLHILILFLCFSFENNKRKIDRTLDIIYFQSLISPVAVFLNYFFNACLAHNLYNTFFSYKSCFEKRIKKYKILAIVGSGLVFIFSLMVNNNSHLTTITYSFTYYSNSFLKLYYLSGLIFIFYIVYKITYVILRKDDFFLMINENFVNNTRKREKKKDLIELFVRRHIFMLIVFIVGFLPNNFIILIQTFLDYKICDDCSKFSLILHVISLSCTISFFLKMTEPYMLKYFYSIINFVLRKKEENLENYTKKDFSNIYPKNESQYIVKKQSKKQELQELLIEPPSANYELNQKYSEEINMSNKNIINLTKNVNTINNITNIIINTNPNLNSEINSKHNRDSGRSPKNQPGINPINKNDSEITINKGKQDVLSKPHPPNKFESIGQRIFIEDTKFNRNLIKKNSSSSISAINERKSLMLEDGSLPPNYDLYDEFRTDLALIYYFWRFLALSIAIYEEETQNKNIFHKQKSIDTIKMDGKGTIKNMNLPHKFLKGKTTLNTIFEDDKVEKSNINKRKTMFIVEKKNEIDEEGEYKEYNKKNIPLRFKSEKIGFERLNIKIKKYESQTFCELRKNDGIKLDDILSSLNPDKNFENLNYALGGRSDSPILFTFDQKYLIKIITPQEKEILIKILAEFRDKIIFNSSYLCRIYGLYDLIVNKKQEVTLIILRNMTELSPKTKLYTFDLKGSTVNRRIIKSEDLDLIKKNDEKTKYKYKKLILKDNDFSKLEISLNISPKDSDKIIKTIEDDADFLNKYNITDYSLLLSIHSFSNDIYEVHKNNPRIFKSIDDRYLYSLSIIDFLGEYEITKKFEVLIKVVSIFIKKSKDYNISACDPSTYAKRLKMYVKKILKQQNLNETFNESKLMEKISLYKLKNNEEIK